MNKNPVMQSRNCFRVAVLLLVYVSSVHPYRSRYAQFGRRVYPTPAASSATGEGRTVAKAFIQSFLMEQEGQGQIDGLSKPTLQVLGGGGSNNLCQETKSADGRLLYGNCNSQKTSWRGRPVRLVRRKRQVADIARRDLLIVLDESGSIGAQRFEKVKKIAALTVKLLCPEISVGSEKTRVALMTFDSKQHFKFSFNSYMNGGNDYVAQQIMNIQYNQQTAGSTCLKRALDYTISNMFIPGMGARIGEYNVRHDVLLISDGCENCDRNIADLKKTMEQFAGDQFNIYVLGVALDETCKEKLKVIAKGGSCYHFFFWDSWDVQIDEFIQDLEYSVGKWCQPAWRLNVCPL